jgi:hypothetical protein
MVSKHTDWHMCNAIRPPTLSDQEEIEMVRRALTLLFFMMTGTALAASSDEDRLFAAIGSNDVAAVDELLEANHALLEARHRGMTPVIAALFYIQKGEGFVDPPKNQLLAAVLRHKPELDIFEACGVGDAARVRELLRKDRSLATAWTTPGWSVLHLAGFSGNAEVVQLLLKEGATSLVNARAKTRFKNTPLQTALLTSQYNTAKVLIENGADVLVRQSKGFTPLMEAAESGRRDLVDLLLEHGAEINSRADDGRNAYTEAMRFGHTEVAEYLKSKGATDGEVTADLSKSPD